MRWVQATLNQVLNLRLPVDGALTVQTRSAIRSFQEKNGLPVTGMVGPDTERALMAAKDGLAPVAGAAKPEEPAGSPPGPGAALSVEPVSSSPTSEFEFKSDEDTSDGFFSRLAGWLTDFMNLTPIEDRTAITSNKYSNLRFGNREKVWALVLHHTAGALKERPEDLDHVNAHFVITPMGRILQLHPIESLLWASHGISRGSVAVEFVGNFRNEKGICWNPGPRFLPCSNQPTPQQIKAGRDLVRYLIQKIGLTTILAHRQSSSSREGDPGPDVWYHVGQWAVDNLGLSDGGPGFRVGDGYAIPDSWRNWGLNSSQPELTIQSFRRGAAIQEEIDPETPDHVQWLQRSLNHVLKLRLPEDGVLGPATRSALRSFQRQRKLDASGVLNLRTEGSLMASGATPHSHPAPGEQFKFETLEFESLSSQPVLRRGSTGAAVVDLQKRLAALGFSPGPADGIFGSLTEAAVKSFQSSRGLSPDGIVGSQTWGALLATTSPQPPGPSGSTGQPQVTIASGALISDNAVRVLKDILRAAGLTQATITRGRATSNDQSRVMYDLIEREGVAYAKNLYGSNGDQVIDVYVAAKAAGKSATDIKFAMESKIKQLGCHNVTHHCSDDYDVFDVAPSSITDDAAFRGALDAAVLNGVIDMYLAPPDDRAFHIEIALKPSEREVMSEIRMSAPLDDQSMGRGLVKEQESAFGRRRRRRVRGEPETKQARIAAARGTPRVPSDTLPVEEEQFLGSLLGYFTGPRNYDSSQSGQGPQSSQVQAQVDRSNRSYIQWVQRSLNKILGLQLAVDGFSGPMTRSAIRSFQQQNGLPPDGTISPMTEAALFRAGATNPPSGGIVSPPGYVPGYAGSSTTGLAWGARVSPAFRARVQQIAAELNIDPNFLMAVMAFESNKTFDPSIRNPSSGATGLIQFISTTATRLGTSTDALARMTAEQQLEYVAIYFRPYRGQLKSIEDVYMAVLWPNAIGLPNETVLFASPSREYEWNRALDANRDGRITKAEAAAPVKAKLSEGLGAGLVG